MFTIPRRHPRTLAPVVLALLVAACQVPAGTVPSEPVVNTTLRMLLPEEPRPDELNPIRAGTPIGSAAIVYRNVLEPLVDIGRRGEPLPRLATKWEQRDATTWRFTLRQGVKFHNGDSFTARDVVELVKWSRAEKDTSRLYAVLPIESAVALDDHTVDLVFRDPQPLLLISLAQMLIWPAAISIDTRKTSETKVIGTGPYKMVEWNLGQILRFSRFDGYWGPKPQIENVEVRFRAEDAVRLAALQTGEADWVYGLTPELASQAPKQAAIPGPQMVWIRFDEVIQAQAGRKSIMADKRLRLAVEYAIDRQALVTLYGSFARPASGQFASAGDFGFNPDLKSRPYDLQKARDLVSEAGAVGQTVTFASEAGDWAKDREIGEAIASMIEKTGLKVKATYLPKAEFLKYKQVKSETQELMVDILVNPLDFNLEVETYFPRIFTKGGTFNATRDPESERLWAEVKAEADSQKRGEKLGKAWAYVYDAVHYVPLFKLPLIWGLAKNLEWDLDISGSAAVADMRFTSARR